MCIAPPQCIGQAYGICKETDRRRKESLVKQPIISQVVQDSVKKQNDFFQSEFQDDKKDSDSFRNRQSDGCRF